MPCPESSCTPVCSSSSRPFRCSLLRLQVCLGDFHSLPRELLYPGLLLKLPPFLMLTNLLLGLLGPCLLHLHSTSVAQVATHEGTELPEGFESEHRRNLLESPSFGLRQAQESEGGHKGREQAE